MTIKVFSVTERRVLEDGHNSNIRIDTLKRAVAAHVTDPREWDTIYLDTLIVIKALNRLATYTQQLPKLASGFYWYVPMSPKYIHPETGTERVYYCAYPDRYRDSLQTIWNRLRRDMKTIIAIIKDTDLSESKLEVLEMDPKDPVFYKLQWAIKSEDTLNTIYLHKGILSKEF